MCHNLFAFLCPAVAAMPRGRAKRRSRHLRQCRDPYRRFSQEEIRLAKMWTCICIGDVHMWMSTHCRLLHKGYKTDASQSPLRHRTVTTQLPHSCLMEKPTRESEVSVIIRKDEYYLYICLLFENTNCHSRVGFTMRQLCGNRVATVWRMCSVCEVSVMRPSISINLSLAFPNKSLHPQQLPH